jgi:hypothetical protein
MARLVIHVRRRDFVSGSHDVTGLQGIAERLPRGVTIYLLPGLTGRQRRAVIRRLRQEASRGCGPELPLLQLVIALLLDRVRGAIGLSAGAVRWHPGVTLLPVAFAAAVMALFVLSSAGVAPGPAPRPALASAQSPAGPGSAADAGGMVAIGGGDADPSARAGAPAARTGRAGIRPSSIGLRGLGPGSGQPTPPGSRGGYPRAAQVCFGAMPGVASSPTQLACHRASS